MAHAAWLALAAGRYLRDELDTRADRRAVVEALLLVAEPAAELADLSPDEAVLWLDTGEAARVLGVSPRTVRDRIARGALDARRTNGGWQWQVRVG